MRVALRVLAFLVACLVGPACTGPRGPADNAPARWSGIVVGKIPMATPAEFDDWSQEKDLWPNCWVLEVKGSATGKVKRVCVHSSTYAITAVGDPYWRKEKYLGWQRP